MLTRRDFIGTGAASAAVLGTSGCLLLGLFRLGARSSLIRSGARASRLSTRGTLSSFGRSGAATLHLLRLTNTIVQINRMQRVAQMFRIEDLQENEAAAVDCDGRSAQCKVEEVPITVTHPDGSWLVHHSNLFRESVGASLPDGEILEHRDAKGRPVGLDVYDGNPLSGRIRHLDKDRNLTGVTTFRYVDDGGGVRAVIEDGRYLRSELRAVGADVMANHAKGLRHMGDATASQNECLDRPNGEECDDLTARVIEALEKLERG